MDKDYKLSNPVLENMRQEGMRTGKILRDKLDSKQFKLLCKKYIDAVASPTTDRKDKLLEALAGMMEVTGEELTLVYYVLEHEKWFDEAIAFGAALYCK